MSEQIDLNKVLEILLDFKGNKIKDYCTENLSKGKDPYIIFRQLSTGLDEIGRGYENKEFRKYFTSDLIISGRNMKKAVQILKPHFNKTNKAIGIVILGTVKGDVHDIGKTILGIMLESNGFKVIDLGVDINKELFIQRIREEKPDVLGMSALLTSTISYMEDVILQLKEEKLRDGIKIIVGGKSVTEEFANRIGADAYGRDCIDGVKKCLAFI
ncbi:cobalamin B12-binding domain-containing protein [[Eubacterium] cellulosolvens]|jgi:5-methyltetrahydrofolate--homocysteine methyltransferase